MNTPVKKFEDLIVWQKAMVLNKEIYMALESCKDFDLKRQMQRAAVSIPSNIAEGFEHRYNKEVIRFLRIASASNAELRTQLIIAISIKHIDHKKGASLIVQTRTIAAMIYKLISYRQKNHQK